MSLFDLFLSQIADPFRIGLIIALVATTLRTAAVTGRALPLAAGVLFVAVLIPTTLTSQAPDPMFLQVGVGVVANAVLLAVAMAVLAVYRAVVKR